MPLPGRLGRQCRAQVALGQARVFAQDGLGACAFVVFDGVEDALRVPRTDVRLFGKPESFVTRRMGVALARDESVDTARRSAAEAAGRVRVSG